MLVRKIVPELLDPNCVFDFPFRPQYRDQLSEYRDPGIFAFGGISRTGQELTNNLFETQFVDVPVHQETGQNFVSISQDELVLLNCLLDVKTTLYETLLKSTLARGDSDHYAGVARLQGTPHESAEKVKEQSMI
jgi:hypothetical protein